jgi:hypothetical protein
VTIEIRQLVIRAVVDARREAEQHGEPHTPLPAQQQRNAAPLDAGPVKIDQDALRSACAREFRRELRKARER